MNIQKNGDHAPMISYTTTHPGCSQSHTGIHALKHQCNSQCSLGGEREVLLPSSLPSVVESPLDPLSSPSSSLVSLHAMEEVERAYKVEYILAGDTQ